MPKTELAVSFAEASKLFDEISGATYYGVAFRQTLMNSPEAVEAAKKLIEALKADKNPSFKD